MENLPLISIIIPVYNTGKFLNRCLDSCISQKYENIEIIAVNDGSTDNSLDILSNYAKMGKRFHVIDKENEGLILTRKRGVVESNGEYIFFLDSDDCIPDNSIDILYSFSCKNNADVVVGGMCYFWDNGKRIIKNNYNPIGNSEIELYASLMLGKIGGNIAGTLIRKEILTGIDFLSMLIIGEDLSVQMQLREHTRNIYYIPNVIYLYYQNTSSIMHKQSDKILRSHIGFCKWQIKYVNSLFIGKEPLIQDALAYSVLNGLFAFIFNGGCQKEYSDYIEMVNSTYLNNKFAANNLPAYIYILLRLNKISSFCGTFLIRSMHHLRVIIKR